MRPNEPDGLDRTVGEEEVVVGGGTLGIMGRVKTTIIIQMAALYRTLSSIQSSRPWV